MRRLPLILAAMAVLATGCLRVDIAVTVEEDGSGEIRAVQAVDVDRLDQFGGAPPVSPDDVIEQLGELPEGVEVEPYEDGNYRGIELITRFDDLEQLEQRQADLGEALDSGLESIGVGFPAGALLAPDITRTDTGWAFEGQGPEGGEELPDQLSLLTDEIEIRLAVRLPGRVTEGGNNADRVEEDSTFVWLLTLDDERDRLFATTTLGAAGEDDSGGALWWLVAGLLVLALLAAVVAWLVHRRRAQRRRPPSGPADGPGEGPLTPPGDAGVPVATPAGGWSSPGAGGAGWGASGSGPAGAPSSAPGSPPSAGWSFPEHPPSSPPGHAPPPAPPATPRRNLTVGADPAFVDLPAQASTPPLAEPPGDPSEAVAGDEPAIGGAGNAPADGPDRSPAPPRVPPGPPPESPDRPGSA